jgi:SseB protein N-terminal domain/SseB protein C-terminal domain
MSLATDNNAAASTAAGPAETTTVERAVTAAIQDASRIGDLLDALRAARLWLPLPAGAAAATAEGAVTLPTVTYLGCEFIPAYTSSSLLAELAVRGVPGLASSEAGVVPHAVVRAADLARLLPPDVGIALNVGATQSVPVYPQGVAFLAADEPADERRISVGPLPVEPHDLLAAVRRELSGIPEVSSASAGWLSVQFAGEGLLISVTLDDPSDGLARDAVVAALESAAQAARHEAGYPMDVTFPGEGAPDHIDRWIATAGQPFYRRAPS